jgi:hypothetical protein
MTVKELEAKCREAMYAVTVDPKLILQLIEERRLLARFIELHGDMTGDELLEVARTSYRIFTEANECKST